MRTFDDILIYCWHLCVFCLLLGFDTKDFSLLHLGNVIVWVKSRNNPLRFMSCTLRITFLGFKKDQTSTEHHVLECPQHKTVPTNTDKAAKSVLAGLSRWTDIRVLVTLIHI